MKSSRWIIVLATTWLACGSIDSHGAVVVNGGFESGLSGWDSIANALAQGQVAGTPPVPPPQGSNHALITTGDTGAANPSVTATALEGFLSLSAGSLTGINANVTRGSAIRQTLTTVNVGDVLSFRWNFLSNEVANTPQNDFSFFSLSRIGGTSTATQLANVNSPSTSIGGPPFATQTGYRLQTFTFTVAGDYVLGFGAANVQDLFGNSGLLVDDVSITSVPEPASLGLLGLGGLLLGVRRRSR